MLTPMDELIDFLREEICERRDYTASKSFEVIIKKIEVEFLEKEKDSIVNAWIHGETRRPENLKHLNNANAYFDAKYKNNDEVF